jgi:TPR repeat protein
MHMMGLRGHPGGKTVLSYFPTKVDELLPLDKVMLRAWYSPRMKGGMTPFEALPVLADELVAAMPDKVAAAQARDRFFAATIDQMQAYAAGRGDIPPIVKRSGKSTEEGIRRGRSEMSFFLGMAYAEGATVTADQKQALSWFERAASAGNRGAQAWLGGAR